MKKIRHINLLCEENLVFGTNQRKSSCYIGTIFFYLSRCLYIGFFFSVGIKISLQHSFSPLLFYPYINCPITLAETGKDHIANFHDQAGFQGLPDPSLT